MGLKQSNALQRLKFSYCKPFFFFRISPYVLCLCDVAWPGVTPEGSLALRVSLQPQQDAAVHIHNRLIEPPPPLFSPCLTYDVSFFHLPPSASIFHCSVPPRSTSCFHPYLLTFSLPLSLRLTFNSAVSLPLSLSPAKPKNSANVVTVQAGSKSVVVAQCEAADGKPAATIKWLTQVGGNHSTSTMNGPDGTVTVRSDYRLVPTPADDGRELTCMVEQRTQERPWALSVRLSVECKDDTHADSFIFWSNYILGFCSNRLDMHQSVLVLSGVAAPYYPS